MSHSMPTPENIKEKAKLARRFLKEKSSVDVSHSHCIEMISQLFGFKDWNTATASLKPNGEEKKYPLKIDTIGDLKKAIAPYEDSASVHADYRFKLRDFLDDLEPDELDDDECHRFQEFHMTMNKFNDDLAIFELVLDDESMEF